MRPIIFCLSAQLVLFFMQILKQLLSVICPNVTQAQNVSEETNHTLSKRWFHCQKQKKKK